MAEWHQLVSGAFTSWKKRKTIALFGHQTLATCTNVWTNMPSRYQNCITEQLPPQKLMVSNQEIVCFYGT
jgi:hypothetical protein